ncbi:MULTISPECIES: HigA family addiction module antitoxin [unclassified Actinomyces]|nr:MULTISPECIES: HigA family addiction module antitoxin [Actinomyces]
MTSGGSASYGLTLERRRLRSLTTTETNNKLAPVHPGEVLMEDFIEGFGITQNKLAVAIGVPPRRINEIVHGKRAVTADTALRLGKYFGVSAQFWLNLQTQYDLDVAEDRLSMQIDAITPLRVA